MAAKMLHYINDVFQDYCPDAALIADNGKKRWIYNGSLAVNSNDRRCQDNSATSIDRRNWFST
jgi:hypothetical protein